MYARIIVVGIATTDIIVHGKRLPARGETLFTGEYSIQGGGKGANHAVAAARLGADTVFISRIGDDDFGTSRLAELAREGINTDYIQQDRELKSSINLVMVDDRGENQAVTALGASYQIKPEDIYNAEAAFRNATVLMLHRGLPRPTMDAALDLAVRFGLFVIYNPVPPERMTQVDRLQDVHVVICNQHELGILSGKPSGHLETTVPAAQVLLEQGAGCVICTLGEKGAVLISSAQDHLFETFKVETRDTNGAGESFAAAFAWYLSHVKDMRHTAVPAVAEHEELLTRAIPFACACSSLSVTKLGAQSSMPTLAEVERFLEEQGRPIASVGDYQSFQPARDRFEFLEEKAKKVRRTLLKMVTEAGSGHPGGALSSTEIMTVLFFHELSLNANRPDWPDRDRFILSKGHSAPVLYACLIEKGILRENEIHTLRKLGSRLQGHPDMRKTPGVEMSTGSLGQGLSVANGIALGLKQDDRESRVYVLLGDGELQEGQVWEAAMSAVHFNLDNLCAIVDYNGLQIGGNIGRVKSTLEPLAGKWESFGWYVLDINGHDIAEVAAAFKQARMIKGRPTVLIAHTIKGKGVSFMERSVEYHGKVPSFELLKQALAELEKE